jgi:hypothetical protein
MLTIIEYDEQNDLFTVADEKNECFTVDASALALMLNRYDEPHEFIGLTFTVQVQA